MKSFSKVQIKLMLLAVPMLIGCPGISQEIPSATAQEMSAGSAQDQPADNMEILREKIGADKKFIIAENMALTESEAKAFWPVYDGYQKELVKLADREIKLIKDYAQSYNTMSDAVAKNLLDEYLDIEMDLQTVRRDYLPKFRGVLTERKVARYYQMESKIDAVVNFELAARIPLVK